MWSEPQSPTPSMVVPWEGWTPGQPTKAPPPPLPPDALPFPKAYQGPVPGPVPFKVPPAQPPPGWREGDPVEQPEIPYKAPPIERPATPPFKAPPPEHLDQVAPGVFGTVAGGGGELDLAMPPPPDPPVPLFDWYRQIQGLIRNVGNGLDFGNPGVPAVLGAVRPHVEVYVRGPTFICPVRRTCGAPCTLGTWSPQGPCGRPCRRGCNHPDPGPNGFS